MENPMEIPNMNFAVGGKWSVKVVKISVGNHKTSYIYDKEAFYFEINSMGGFWQIAVVGP